MRSHIAAPSRRLVAVAAALLGGAGLLAIPAGSRADLDSVRPNEGFQGEVNGSSASGATVYVVPSGSGPGCTVDAGQTVDVFTDATVGGPRTGALDSYVDEYFDSSPSQKIRIDKYGEHFAKAIPTTFDAPCDGQGQAIFAPGPGPGGVNDVVALHFVEHSS